MTQQAPKIVIYSKEICPYCVRAKQFFEQKGLAYTEIRVDQDPAALEKMLQITQRRTVPQIFINDQHIGGCDDLMALAATGQFAQLINVNT